MNKKYNYLRYFMKKVCNNNVMLTVIVFSFLLIGTMSVITNSNAEKSDHYNKNFKTIVIENGDTLSSIAEEYAINPADYKDYIEEVKNINNLKNDTIHYGCYLLIPVYDTY